ncbi:MAG: phenylalanine--tRNA ligase subunit beta [Candidatus Aenigmarchaeota archaeon]|nr:phenylalanine--tRNA ligase subunit beta [Candidatus Aenigmarchaeota archaeon]
MALIGVDRSYLSRLVGRQLTDADIEQAIPMLGCPYEGKEGSKLFFEIFPNRPDLLSAEGFARALRSFFGLGNAQVLHAGKGKLTVTVDRSVAGIRPHIACAVTRGARLEADQISSLIQLQEKIDETMGRKRKKIAIGLHDLDKVEAPFTYTAVGPHQIKFVPLDLEESMTPARILAEHPKGVKYGHILEGAAIYPVILDRNRQVLSLPPIINGELTKVTEKTKNLFIDITGPQERPLHEALNIICMALAEAGCSIETVKINGRVSPDLAARSMLVDIKYANRLLGTSLSAKEFASLAQRMGLAYRNGTVAIPPYRNDIMHGMDVVEDIAIAYGYQNFVPILPAVPTAGGTLLDGRFVRLCSRLLEGSGFQQVVTMSLVNEEEAYAKMGRVPEKDACRMRNSVSSECTMFRTSLLPGVLKTFSQNKHNAYPQKIFEAGEVMVLDNQAETGATGSVKLAAGWSDGNAGYEKLAPIIDSLLANVGRGYKLVPAEHAGMINGRAARIVAGTEVGVIGEVHPAVLEKWNLEKPAAVFEINLSALLAGKRKAQGSG